jgi:hypothetical protein
MHSIHFGAHYSIGVDTNREGDAAKLSPCLALRMGYSHQRLTARVETRRRAAGYSPILS